ncbi:phosphocholine-specific phospholipase C [Rhizomicrobium palustre]|nr:phospholipase C, phosphocholine-specific [Rhizomicrobium palustre]
MAEGSRRGFIKLATASLGAGAAMAMLPPSIQKALAVAPNRKTGTIKDVEHVIILMQENRSFDHYFGTLRGVRGFSDPHPITLPGGKPVWQQPDAKGKPLSPFHFDTKATDALVVPSTDHSWKKSHDAWKHHDAWVQKKGPMTMGYFTREDLPFHYALADAFTICDNYHCSVFGPTNPNRLFLWTGTSGVNAGNDGEQAITNPDGESNGTADAALDSKSFKAWEWTTYAERLEAAGISWKVYQEYDNFDDNPLTYFKNFRFIDKNSNLYKRGRTYAAGSNPDTKLTSRGEYLLAEMEAALKKGEFPQVSWIVTSALLSEHPATSSPAYGEEFISKLLGLLAAYPDIWSKTVLFVNFDENDGLFDHMPIPIPAPTADIGKSTVAATGEVYHGVPFGLGPRVPMFVISPWTKGGFVNSQLFDHSSVLRFLEQRFGVTETNITPWRRAVCGDLTSAFDFSKAEEPWDVILPDTSDYSQRVEAAKKLPKTTPVHDAPLPRQEKGQRLARPLPYALSCDAKIENGKFVLRMRNTGTAGACFIAYAEGQKDGPWFYTVEAGKTLEDEIAVKGKYHFTVHGPNGFFRAYQGEAGESPVLAELSADADAVVLTLRNTSAKNIPVTVVDDYASGNAHVLSLLAGQTIQDRWEIAAHDHWYDLSITAGAQRLRFSGHVETGKVSRSDPALG